MLRVCATALSLEWVVAVFEDWVRGRGIAGVAGFGWFRLGWGWLWLVQTGWRLLRPVAEGFN